MRCERKSKKWISLETFIFLLFLHFTTEYFAFFFLNVIVAPYPSAIPSPTVSSVSIIFVAFTFKFPLILIICFPLQIVLKRSFKVKMLLVILLGFSVWIQISFLFRLQHSVSGHILEHGYNPLFIRSFMFGFYNTHYHIYHTGKACNLLVEQETGDQDIQFLLFLLPLANSIGQIFSWRSLV